MDLKEIQELIKIVDESKLTTFELEEEGFKIVLKKEIAGQLPAGPATPPNIPAAGARPEEPGLPVNQRTINSPIVGTFYASAAPGEEPFVQPGKSVKKGDILCIIEAMKLMNEIEADEELQILEILVKDGQMVEYGQPLFSIK